MSKKKSKRPPSTPYSRQLRELMDRYAAEMNKTTVSTHEVAAWAIARGLYKPPPADARKKLAKDMAEAARLDYTEDDDGLPVRRRHAYKVKTGDVQLTLWVNIEDATRGQMHMAASQRRRGIQSDCAQLDRDVRHYNKHFNPGDDLEMDYNFNECVQEGNQPAEYDDTPPEDEVTDDQPE